MFCVYSDCVVRMDRVALLHSDSLLTAVFDNKKFIKC